MLDKVTKNGNLEKKPWKIEPTTIAKNCRNYMREIVETLDLKPNPDKKFINLAVGDPAVFGNLNPAKETIDAVLKVVQEGKHNGYSPSMGHLPSREAVADYLSYNGAHFTANDIILCSGCSSALDTSITALVDGSKGQNILVPRPGFPMYRTSAEALSITIKGFNLVPERNWEIDLDHLQSQIDEKTAAILINNPSNPAGSNYSREHLKQILAVAERNRIPVIADEIYERLVFKGQEFISAASVQSGVPILICGGLGKRFLAPGWRMGWIAIHDENNYLAEIRNHLITLCQRIIGSNTLIQGAIPGILQTTPQSFYDNVVEKLSYQAKIAYNKLSDVKGLIPYMPSGTIFMVVKYDLTHFPGIKDGLQLVEKLMTEESVFVLPGECFQIPGFVRIVSTVPEDLMKEACDRVAAFFNRYYVD